MVTRQLRNPILVLLVVAALVSGLTGGGPYPEGHSALEPSRPRVRGWDHDPVGTKTRQEPKMPVKTTSTSQLMDRASALRNAAARRPAPDREAVSHV